MRQPSPRPNRRASTAILLVAALTLSLSPASAAAAADCDVIPTSCPADGGNASGYYYLAVADEAGQCDPDTGELTGSFRHSWENNNEYGYPDGAQDYLVGDYLLIGNVSGVRAFDFCIEIEHVEDAAGFGWWEGEGSGVISSLAGQPMDRMSSLHLGPKLDFWELQVGWSDPGPGGWNYPESHIHGRYNEAADPDISGIFRFRSHPLGDGGGGDWQMVRDTY